MRRKVVRSASRWLTTYLRHGGLRWRISSEFAQKCANGSAGFVVLAPLSSPRRRGPIRFRTEMDPDRRKSRGTAYAGDDGIRKTQSRVSFSVDQVPLILVHRHQEFLAYRFMTNASSGELLDHQRIGAQVLAHCSGQEGALARQGHRQQKLIGQVFADRGIGI